MTNYFTMKNVDLVAALEAKDLAVPYRSDGNLNRKEAAQLLMDAQTDEEKASRRINERVLCVVHGDGTEEGQEAIYVGVMSIADDMKYNAVVPREVEVEMPAFAYDYLNGLHTMEYIPIYDADGKSSTVQRRVKRFKMTELDRYSKEQ